MNSRIKSIFCVLIAMVMVLAIVPFSGIEAKAESGDVTYELVTDVSDLAAGDEIIIVAKDYDVAMSTTQNKNNRGQATIVKTENTIVNPSDSVQTFTLEQGTVANTFAFECGDGKYIYAAGVNSNNYLRAEDTKTNNSSWTISVDANGTATITAQGGNTRNLLRYNSGNSLFSCYASGQQEVQVYVKLSGEDDDTPCTHENLTKVEAAEATCTESGNDAYWACKKADGGCGKMFSDENAENEINEIPGFVAALGHDYDIYTGVCARCDDNWTERALALASNSSLGGTYTLVGKITNIDTKYDEKYKNISVTIEAKTGFSILCYRLAGGKALDVGDVIEVTGAVKKYNDTLEFDAACTYLNNFFETMSLTLDEGLNVNCYSLGNRKVDFTLGGQTATLESGEKQADGTFKYTLKGVGPQNMGDEITVNVYDKEGTTVVETKTFTIKSYLNDLKASDPENTELVTLANDLLVYGGAAQTYKNHNTENLVSDGVSGTAWADLADTAITVTDGTVTFTNANIYFDTMNKAVFGFTAATIEDLEVTINGTAAEIVANGEAYYVMSDAISAKDYANATFTVEAGTASLTYSVAAYTSAMQDKGTNGAELAKAAYQYSLSAAAYAAANE